MNWVRIFKMQNISSIGAGFSPFKQISPSECLQPKSVLISQSAVNCHFVEIQVYRLEVRFKKVLCLDS